MSEEGCRCKLDTRCPWRNCECGYVDWLTEKDA
jgi:hypothetical protein